MSASKVGTFASDEKVSGAVHGLSVQPDRSPRVYMLLAPSEAEQQQWLEVLQAAAARARRSATKRSLEEDVDPWESAAAIEKAEAAAAEAQAWYRGVIEEARAVYDDSREK